MRSILKTRTGSYSTNGSMNVTATLCSSRSSRLRVPAADANKAEVASISEIRMPRTPFEEDFDGSISADTFFEKNFYSSKQLRGHAYGRCDVHVLQSGVVSDGRTTSA